ncbi:hypothetical protein PAMP_020810 [Pampus punctatissimus]
MHILYSFSNIFSLSASLYSQFVKTNSRVNVPSANRRDVLNICGRVRACGKMVSPGYKIHSKLLSSFIGNSALSSSSSKRVSRNELSSLLSPPIVILASQATRKQYEHDRKTEDSKLQNKGGNTQYANLPVIAVVFTPFFKNRDSKFKHVVSADSRRKKHVFIVTLLSPALPQRVNAARRGNDEHHIT